MKPLVVCSFWVHRAEEFPDAVDYLPLLKALDRSCRRFGIAHAVLTDEASRRRVSDAGLLEFATDLPINLMQALTTAQLSWIESGMCRDADTLFVGADCLIAKDPRGEIPAGDLVIAFRPHDKRHRINNGFMFVPKASRDVVTPLFRRIAERCGPTMCDDLVAIEATLSPMPQNFGTFRRAGADVTFVPMAIWNARPLDLADPVAHAFVLHFRGQHRKQLMIDWAARHLC